MKLEQQVCSLELAQKLKELGVKQESEFHWRVTEPNHESALPGGPFLLDKSYLPYDSKMVSAFSAFTVAELGEMLPTFCELEGTNRVFNCWKEPQGWQCAYCPHSGVGDWGLKEAKTEADARAKMLIYLLENKLISVE